MKKDLYHMLDELTPEELDTLPEEIFSCEQPDDVTMKRIQNAVAEKTGLSFTAEKNHSSRKEMKAKTNSKRTASRSFRFVFAAACMALVAGIGAGTYSYAAARREYNNALEFFYENNLSTAGLTKSEIKKVYRDFSTHSFDNTLTTDVIVNSRPDLLQGYEIVNSDWDNTLPSTALSDYHTSVSYEYFSDYDASGGTVLENRNDSIFRKYHNGEQVWEITLTDLTVHGFYNNPASKETPVLVYGYTPYDLIANGQTASLIALDADGNIVWRAEQDNGDSFDQIQTVLCDADGSYVAFGRYEDAERSYLCVNKYSKGGQPTAFTPIDLEYSGIENAALTEDGYLVEVYSYANRIHSLVLKLDKDGTLVDSFQYESDDSEFYVTDFCEHNNKVYISGYTTPKGPGKYLSFMNDFFTLKEDILMATLDGNTLTKDELLALYRKQFTAVLLICEPESGTPEDFYTIKGSLGDEVYVNNDSVCWFTKDIIESSYTPEEAELVNNVIYVTKQADYRMLCRFYANTFDTEGAFLAQKKLDLMAEKSWR